MPVMGAPGTYSNPRSDITRTIWSRTKTHCAPRRVMVAFSIAEVPQMSKLDKEQVVEVLNRLLEAELAGVVRYTHYSLLVFGFSRIPVVSWLREQANESLLHAQQVGEWITALGSYPSLGIGPLLDSHKHDISSILQESLAAEGEALAMYRELLRLAEGRSVAIEEFARQMIYAEEMHAAEVDKMLRKPGDVLAFSTTS
jgi:bacterioferritin